MAKKQHNIQALTNQLSGSAFFPSRHVPITRAVPDEPANEDNVDSAARTTHAHAQASSTPQPVQTATRTDPLQPVSAVLNHAPVPLVRDVPPVPLEAPVLHMSPAAPRRKIKQRHPFDIYEDQLETLKQLSLEDRMKGGIGSMSAMVREALDTFIAKKRGK